MTADEEAALLGDKELTTRVVSAPEDDGPIPSWAQPWLPAGLKIPASRQPKFLRFKSAWTDAPQKGVPSMWPKNPSDAKGDQEEHLTRVLMLWEISDAEERLALKAAAQDRTRLMAEYAKHMIRSVDGMAVDWTMAWAKGASDLYSPDRLWTELGAKCRQPVVNLYLKLHSLSDAEMADFLLNGLGVGGVAG